MSTGNTARLLAVDRGTLQLGVTVSDDLWKTDPVSEPIWKKNWSIELMNERCEHTIHAPLGIRFTEQGPNFLAGSLAVGPSVKQPFGVMHGGTSAVLAESLGSMAAYLTLEGEDSAVLGVEIHVNHIKAVRDGFITGTAVPVHLGNTIQVWQIDIRDEAQALVSTSRLTVLVRAKQARPT